MNYVLYTTVDITHTGQYKNEPGKEHLKWQEQNFNTVLQTLGLRGNVCYGTGPVMIRSPGSLYGFNTAGIIPIWVFEFTVPYRDAYKKQHDPIGFLLDDFEMVPFISGLSEPMTQNYDVFVTRGLSKNVVFLPKR